MHDPDKDTVAYRSRSMSPSDIQANEQVLMQRLTHLIDKANFDELDVSSIGACVFFQLPPIAMLIVVNINA